MPQAGALAAGGFFLYPSGVRAFLLAALLTAPASAAAPARLRHEPRCILEAVARDLNEDIGRHRGPAVSAALRGAARAAGVPRVRLESETPLIEFLTAVRPQDPSVNRFSNFYSVTANRIFLIDDAAYYAKFAKTSRRSMEDSLAHEFVHYLQVTYLGYTVADLGTEDAEAMAIGYQTSYRERYIVGGESPPCPADK